MSPTSPVANAGGLLMAELWYDHEPVLDPTSVLAAVRETHPDAVSAGDESLMVAFPSLTAEFSDRSAHLLVTTLGPTVESPDTGKPRDLSQTWSWPGAAEALARTTHTLVVADLLGRVQPPQPRVAAFRAVLRAICAQSGPVGTWWPVNELATMTETVLAAPLGGLVNVRLFNDADRPGYMVMDTLGMHTLGLPDAQVYFHDLDVARVAGLLYALAAYVFKGADIRPGHTVQGLAPDQKWRVSHKTAMVNPERVVLNLSTGG